MQPDQLKALNRSEPTALAQPGPICAPFFVVAGESVQTECMYAEQAIDISKITCVACSAGSAPGGGAVGGTGAVVRGHALNGVELAGDGVGDLLQQLARPHEHARAQTPQPRAHLSPQQRWRSLTSITNWGANS